VFGPVLAARRSRRAGSVSALGLVTLVAGCPDDGDEGDGDDDGSLACVDVDPDGCAELYPPSWDRVYTDTLVNKCATGGLSCHGSADAEGAALGGLFFAEPSAAHALLLEDRGEESYVIPGDPDCSLLVIRLATDDPIRRMPPGSTLQDGEICSVAKWIAQGAMP